MTLSDAGRDPRQMAVGLAAEGRTHAILIEGETGVGKCTLAQKMAAAALCRSSGKRPCGICESCLKAADGCHPDIVVMGGMAANSIKVDDIRALKSDAAVRPNDGDKKVFILRDSQNLTVQAQNALLKVLEEPPKSVLFLLTCDNRGKLLETIVSRTAVVRIGGLSEAECTGLLAERFPGQDREALRELCILFEGNPGRCITALEQGEKDGENSLLSLSEKAGQALAAASDWELLCLLSGFEKNKEGFRQFLELLTLRCATGGKSRRELIQAAALLDAIETAKRDMERNAYFPLLAATLCVRLRAVTGGR